MKCWVDRKIFIHNLGHAAAAYAGYLYNPAFTYVYEVMETPLLEEYVRKTMKQSAEILQAKYPGEFNWNDLTEHIEDLIQRFKNRALGDTAYRVGRDLFRKLGPKDRLVQPIKEGIKLNKPVDYLLAALVFGFYFRKTDEHGELFPQDEEFVQYFQQGVPSVMQEVCGFDPEKDSGLITEAQSLAQKIESSRFFSDFLRKEL
jgi:mannitol-1-phosphate 5-dehydrogenase